LHPSIKIFNYFFDYIMENELVHRNFPDFLYFVIAVSSGRPEQPEDTADFSFFFHIFRNP